MTPDKPGLFTLAVRQLQVPQSDALPAVPPIVPAVGFTHPDMEAADRALDSSGGSLQEPDHFVYARYGAPTQAVFEATVAALEDAESGLSFSSGMAALHAALVTVAQPGAAVVAAHQLYGATHGLLAWFAAHAGLTVRYADFLDPDAVARAIDETRPVAVLCEVVTNPLVRVVPVDAVIALARAAGALVIVDNTFATPYLLRPLTLGADLVVHSATKFLNGHGDVTGGVIVGPRDRIEQARMHRRIMGGVLGAFDAWLALRGLRTLGVRMAHACQTAARLAAWLSQHPRVSRVYYPGLPDDPCHADARRLFRPGAFGAMLAFDVAGLDRAGAFALADRLQVIRRVTSLGDVNTLLSHPAVSSHRALTPEQRAAQGILEGTLRLSVGIEDADDLIADLSGALDAVG